MAELFNKNEKKEKISKTFIMSESYKIISKVGNVYIVKYPATDNTFKVDLTKNIDNRKYWEEKCRQYDIMIRKQKLEKLLS